MELCVSDLLCYFSCKSVMFQVHCIVAARSSNGSQSSSSGSSGPPLLTAHDERIGFEAAVAALGLTSSVAVCSECAPMCLADLLNC